MTTEATTDEWVSASEAARMLGVTRQRIANMIRDHDIDCVRPWPRTVLINRHELDRYLSGVRGDRIHKTAVRRWMFNQDPRPADQLTPQDTARLVRAFIEEKRPEWDAQSKTNWVVGMLDLLS